MKFVAISDTHGCHRQLHLPEGEVLLHAGDVCNKGDARQVEDFLDWLDGLNFQHKIIIRGNHDIDLPTGKSLLEREMPKRTYQLMNSGIVIENIPIWGVPYPTIESTEDWESIPLNTRILISHRPPFGIMDQPPAERSKGSHALKQRVKLVEPEVHFFGHIHAGYGQQQIGKTLFINGSGYKESLARLVNPPVVFSIKA